jgi:hypothetical protein
MAKEKSTKKILRTQIADKLVAEFANLKENVEEKKFIKNVKKASKNLTAGYTEPKEKVPAKPKKKAAAATTSKKKKKA